MQYIVLVNGAWIEWIPPVGLSDAIGKRATWIGAITYGQTIASGASEDTAQQEAERAAYCAALRVRYV